jgi:capsular polysaccharide transport system ATP-binding protein
MPGPAVGDSRFHEKCRTELFEKRKDRSLIIVSHDIHNIREHCNRACVIDRGKLYEFPDIDMAYDFYNQSV